MSEVSFELMKQMAQLAEADCLEAILNKRSADEILQQKYVKFCQTRRMYLLAQLPADTSLVREQLEKDPDMEDLLETLSSVHDSISGLTEQVAAVVGKVIT